MVKSKKKKNKQQKHYGSTRSFVQLEPAQTSNQSGQPEVRGLYRREHSARMDDQKSEAASERELSKEPRCAVHSPHLLGQTVERPLDSQGMHQTRKSLEN